MQLTRHAERSIDQPPGVNRRTFGRNSTKWTGSEENPDEYVRHGNDGQKVHTGEVSVMVYSHENRTRKSQSTTGLFETLTCDGSSAHDGSSWFAFLNPAVPAAHRQPFRTDRDSKLAIPPIGSMVAPVPSLMTYAEGNNYHDDSWIPGHDSISTLNGGTRLLNCSPDMMEFTGA